jgi:hypothetical protein
MSVVAMLGTLVLSGVLALAGLVKLVRPEPAARALAAAGRVGFASRPGPSGMPATLFGRSAALRALGALELCIGLGVLAAERTLLAVAAVLLWVFAAWLWRELARGRSGEPCPCFGARSAIGVRSGSATLALALLATGLLGAGAGADGGGLPRLSALEWLALACGLLACAGLALAWVAFLLAREVADLRAQLARGGPRGALEILEEGPPLGCESPLIERFAGEQEIALAVFLSPGCAVCRELEPALTIFGAQSATELVVFDEVREQLAWHSAAIPGSPYAVALDRQGMTLAKGTFNTLEQLASIPATARSRRREVLARV